MWIQSSILIPRSSISHASILRRDCIYYSSFGDLGDRRRRTSLYSPAGGAQIPSERRKLLIQLWYQRKLSNYSMLSPVWPGWKINAQTGFRNYKRRVMPARLSKWLSTTYVAWSWYLPHSQDYQEARRTWMGPWNRANSSLSITAHTCRAQTCKATHSSNSSQ